MEKYGKEEMKGQRKLNYRKKHREKGETRWRKLGERRKETRKTKR